MDEVLLEYLLREIQIEGDEQREIEIQIKELDYLVVEDLKKGGDLMNENIKRDLKFQAELEDKSVKEL